MLWMVSSIFFLKDVKGNRRTSDYPRLTAEKTFVEMHLKTNKRLPNSYN